MEVKYLKGVELFCKNSSRGYLYRAHKLKRNSLFACVNRIMRYHFGYAKNKKEYMIDIAKKLCTKLSRLITNSLFNLIIQKKSQKF